MQIEYDPEADALYLRISDTKPARNVDIDNGITADFDQNKRFIGLEILNVKKKFGQKSFSTITFQNLMSLKSSK